MKLTAPYFRSLLCLALASFGQTARAAFGPGEIIKFVEEDGQLHIRLGEINLATYLMKSDIIKRPCFINLHTAKGKVATRPFPVQEDPKNGGDHPDMHPGLWLGFGDINGVDFWRNKGRVEHVRFRQKPVVDIGVGNFEVENRFVAPDGREVCRQVLHVEIRPHQRGWSMLLHSMMWSLDHELILGAQEEMGLGVRVAAHLAEKGGGHVWNSLEDTAAKDAWGKEAAWWECGDAKGAGIMITPVDEHTPKCWGHTRDYGLVVANPIPRAPDASRVRLAAKEIFSLGFMVLIHEPG